MHNGHRDEEDVSIFLGSDGDVVDMFSLLIKGEVVFDSDLLTRKDEIDAWVFLVTEDASGFGVVLMEF